MNNFRHSYKVRLFALGLLIGLGGWLVAPLAVAHPQVAAAQLARAYAAGPLEAAVAEALSVAARSSDAPGAFEKALHAALEAHPEGQALADLLASGETPATLLDLLVGSLLQSRSATSQLLLAAAALQQAQNGANGLRGLPAGERSSMLLVPASEGVQEGAGLAVGVPIEVLSSAQPLGP